MNAICFSKMSGWESDHGPPTARMTFTFSGMSKDGMWRQGPYAICVTAPFSPASVMALATEMVLLHISSEQ